MTRRIAIIPARGGSKRIPLKNIRDFCGKPMIAYALQAARESDLFDVIHVSTDDARVRETVEQLGFPIEFMRPAELADDFTPLMPVHQYVLEEYGKRGQGFDEVWQLMPCAPFLEKEDLLAASRLMASFQRRKPVIAVARYPVPIEWAFRSSPDGSLTPVQPGMFAVRSQDLEQAYYETGALLVYPEPDVRYATGAGLDTNYAGYEIARHKAVDIDDEDDWRLAEALFMGRRRP